MAEASTTHLVLIPSFNPGPRVFTTVQAALDRWSPVWVVVDGSTDDSAERLRALTVREPGLKVLCLPHNQGKGAAVLHGIRAAMRAGFTHALTMDSDGQHPADQIPTFMHASFADPQAMILGRPVFDASAPRIRVQGRKISNSWADLETLWAGIGDSLYGFRVYPLEPLETVMRGQRWMRRFDFDVEAVVRLCWRGIRPRNLAAPVRYFGADDGGVSHFRYGRDNVLLTWMHFRLFCGFLLRLPVLLWTWVAARSDRYIMAASGSSVPVVPRNPSKFELMADNASHLQQSAPAAAPALQRELATLIVGALNLEMAAEAIDPHAPLFGEGLGLDSIDILEVALLVSKRYGVQLRADAEDNQQIFRSLSNLADYIAAHRTQ